LHHICEETGVTVPVLLYHDEEEHVLIISDLGILPNLSELFGHLMGMPLAKKVGEKSSAPSRMVPISISPVEGLTIGQKAGSFFAGLHQPENVAMIAGAPYNDPYFLKQDGMLDMILDSAIKPVKEQLCLFPHLTSSSTAARVYRYLEDNFTRTPKDDEKVIALGDCWTGALLIGLEGTPAAPQVGIIDWEFASVGRGIDGDMAQLLAHLSLFEVAATWQGNLNSRAAVAAIIQGLTNEYRRRNQVLNPLYVGQSASLAPEPYSLGARILRSAFLTHGGEIVNNAFWKEWACESSLCCGKEAKGKRHCMLIQAMVKRGWWYLYHAQENENEFVSRQNWDSIRSERVLFPMLYDCCNEVLGGDSQQLRSDATV
jgi:hypothetical protein